MAEAPPNVSNPALEEETGRTEIMQSLGSWIQDLKETPVYLFLVLYWAYFIRSICGILTENDSGVLFTYL